MNPSPKTATYLFCMTRSGVAQEALEGSGVDESSSIELVRHDDIAAVTCTVALDEFTDAFANERVKDVEWLTKRALRHEQIIEQVARHAAVLPARFATLFLSRDNLERRLAEHHDEIVAFLDRVEDKEEWAVKGYVDRKKAWDAATREAAAQMQDAKGSASPGTQYIRAQRARSQAEGAVSQWLARASEQAVARITPVVEARAERQVLQLTEEGLGEMVLNWAFLVPRARTDELRHRIEQINQTEAEHGLVLRASGPWPPFSFTPALGETEA